MSNWSKGLQDLNELQIKSDTLWMIYASASTNYGVIFIFYAKCSQINLSDF